MNNKAQIQNIDQQSKHINKIHANHNFLGLYGKQLALALKPKVVCLIGDHFQVFPFLSRISAFPDSKHASPIQRLTSRFLRSKIICLLNSAMVNAKEKHSYLPLGFAQQPSSLGAVAAPLNDCISNSNLQDFNSKSTIS